MAAWGCGVCGEDGREARGEMERGEVALVMRD